MIFVNYRNVRKNHTCGQTDTTLGNAEQETISPETRWHVRNSVTSAFGMFV